MREQLRQGFNRFAYAGCQPSDTDSERLRKAILVSIPTGISVAAIIWVSGYLILGRPLSAAIPGSYAVFSLLSVFLFFRTKHFGFFRFSQLFLILWLPFLLQWSLGGFNSGSAVMIWAILSPIGALMFHGVRQAVPWFAAYIVLTVVSGVFDKQLATAITPLPLQVISTFYVLNIGVSSLLVYAVVNYFVTENKHIIGELSAEKTKTEHALQEAERQRRAAEAQRAAAEQSKAVIEAQSNKLIEMDRIKTRFFSNISHEFRTPLTLIIAPLEDSIVGTTPLARTQLQVMLRNCRRLLRLINQLLDISKLEAGEMKLNLGRGNLVTFIEGICRSFTPFAERKKIKLQVSSDVVETDICFDAEKLEKIFYNLLSNALKFTPDGGKLFLKISAAAEEPGEDILEISVKDTGEGIPKDELPYIFDRFRQVDGSSTREHEGTGIGLSLVKDLVALHGGTIQVQSEPGFGSEFTIRLPRNMGQSQLPVPPSASSVDFKSQLTGLEDELIYEHESSEPAVSTAVSGTEAKLTVLIIDDNPDIRVYLQDCLAADYRVVQAIDGVTGLQQIRSVMPDLVISDIMMPGLDGYDLCRTVKSDPQLKYIPVILLTAKASEEMKVEGLECGADDYVAKPFNSRELLARVSNLIVLHQQQADLKSLNEELKEKVKEQLEAILRGKRLTRYFPNKMLEKILSSDEESVLSSERRKVTVLFSDLCGFTELSDSLEPEQVTHILNEYLAEMFDLIAQHGATLDKFMGDGLMVMFGAPDEMNGEDQAYNAITLGVLMQRKLDVLGKKWSDDGIDHHIRMRIGINQDYVTVGNFGSERLVEYTAIGNGVNLASRIEASCTPGRIKVSYPIYQLTSEQYPYEDLMEEKYKGFLRLQQVCELVPEKAA